MNIAVETDKLTKSYGKLTVVNNLSLSIKEGEIFGLLGPNGAGKTTTLEMIEGLIKPDSGTISICGLDTAKNKKAVKEIIGVQLQNTSMYETLSLEELINLFGGYYDRSVSVSELLEAVSLSEKRKNSIKQLSGGQRQRVGLAMALVNDPQIVFLDEPTNALDPQTKRNVWHIIQSLKKKNKTVIMNTHYMEEAERLCDRVAIMDHGQIITTGKPEELIAEEEAKSSDGKRVSLEDVFLSLTGTAVRDI